MKKIGFTTSIPVEVIFAAGLIPVDLNNIFVISESPSVFVEKAESYGFPRNTCAWIKGIFSAIMATEDLNTIISVVEGDCSNTRALTEVLSLNNIKCIPFSYPHSRSYTMLKNEIEVLCKLFNVTLGDCLKVKKQLDTIRKRLLYLDELTWKHNKASGFENHLWQVSSSDFNSNLILFASQLESVIELTEKRNEKNQKVRLGYIGVPPIFAEIYDFVEEHDARFVYNEVQRQFTMAHGIDNDDIVEVYRQFTYPYDLNGRLEDIKKQIELRKIDGIVHYTQAFCFRGIEDIVIRKELGVPVLTLEGDRPGGLDARTKLRVESFIEMLS